MTLVGEPFKGHNPMPNMLRDLANSSNYKERKNIIEKFNKNNKWKKRGIIMLPTKYGISFTSTMKNQGGALVHVRKP